MPRSQHSNPALVTCRIKSASVPPVGMFVDQLLLFEAAAAVVQVGPPSHADIFLSAECIPFVLHQSGRHVFGQQIEHGLLILSQLPTRRWYGGWVGRA